MKLTLKEFEAQLALGKNLEGDARKKFYETLKSAQVVEVDAEGKETPVEVTVIDNEPEAPATTEPEPTKAVDPAEVAAIVKRVVADITPVRKNPLNATGSEIGKGFTIPATVKRSSNLQCFKSEESAYKFGMWAMAGLGNERAKSWCASVGMKLHSEGNNANGGYLVPEEFGTDMIRLVETYGVARRIFKMRQMSSETRSDPRRTGGLTAYFVGEGNAGTESAATWDRINLVAKKLMVLSRMTSELNEDAAISIGDELGTEAALALALKEDQCGFLGDGTSQYGGIVGIATKLTSVNGVDEGGGIILASGNLFSEFTLADFNRVVGRIPQYADNANTRWVASRTFYYGTMQRLELAAGGVSAVEVREGNRRPMFLGYPVEISQVMPTADANSQVACTFGDHSQAASFGDRRQITIKLSEEATVGGESTFERDEVAVKVTERIDENVHDVGTSTAAGPVVGLLSQSA